MKPTINTVNLISMESPFTHINQSLIAGCINKNRISQWKLYNLLSPSIYTQIIDHGFNKEEAEEILQKVFISIFNSVEKYNRNVSFEDWCLEIYKNTIRSYFISSTQ